LFYYDAFGKGFIMPAKVDKEKCTACEACISECPSEAISMVEEKAQVNPEACIDCGVCVDACPEQAISME
jgi:ferredoxin